MMTRLTYGKSTWRKNSPVWKQISIYCRTNTTDIFHFSFYPRTLRDWDFPRSRNRWFILSYPVFPCLKVCEMSLGHHQFNNIDVISSKYRCFIWCTNCFAFFTLRNVVEGSRFALRMTNLFYLFFVCPTLDLKIIRNGTLKSYLSW